MRYHCKNKIKRKAVQFSQEFRIILIQCRLTDLLTLPQGEALSQYLDSGLAGESVKKNFEHENIN